MSKPAIHTIIKMSNFQTLGWLIVCCLIMWTYVLPDAKDQLMYTAGVSEQLDLEEVDYLQIVEMTAGLVNRLLTFVLVFLTQVYLIYKYNHVDPRWVPILFLPLVGFGLSLVSSICAVSIARQQLQEVITIRMVLMTISWLCYGLALLTGLFHSKIYDRRLYGPAP